MRSYMLLNACNLTQLIAKLLLCSVDMRLMGSRCPHFSRGATLQASLAAQLSQNKSNALARPIEVYCLRSVLQNSLNQCKHLYLT